jgi:hypothetical protein
MKQYSSIKIILLVCLFCGCNEEKYPIESLPQQEKSANNVSDTLYVKQNPDWIGFNDPEAIIVGNEPLVYVADTYNDRIVMLDLAGRVIGYSQKIKRPIAIAQDKRLQLLVCAQFDTTLPGRTTMTTFGAVYRLNLPAVGHAIAQAVPQRVFCELSDSVRRYTAVATLYNDWYYIARAGRMSSNISIDPDNAILLFSKNDELISPVTSNFQPNGTGLYAIDSVMGLATMPTGTSVEFVYSQVENRNGVVPFLKVQWIKLISEGQTTNYASKFPSIDPSIDFMQINKFKKPRGVALDPSGNLFVVDAEKDSMYRFNTRGVEQYSFGGHDDPYGRNFNEPYSIAYFDKTIYIADRGNNRICRYKLSIDMN